MGEDSFFRENYGVFIEEENFFFYFWEDQSFLVRLGGYFQEVERVQKDGDVFCQVDFGSIRNLACVLLGYRWISGMMRL